MFKNLLVIGWFCGSMVYGQWTQLNDVPFTSMEDGSAVWDDTAYVLSSTDRLLYIYDEQADSFSSVPAEWFFRASEMGVFAIDGKIYASGARQVGQGSVNDLWYAYNIATGVWEEKASFPFEPVALNALRMFRINNSVYLIDTNFELFYRYDVASDSWTELTYTFPTTSFQFLATTFTVNNQAFLGSAADVSANVGNQWYTYDPLSNAWTTVSPLVTDDNPRDMRCAEHNGFAYCATGRLDTGSSGAISSNKVFQYDPTEDSWQELMNVPYSAAGAFVFVLNDELYMGAGLDGLNFFDDFYKQPIATLQTTEVKRKKPSVAYLRNQREFVSDVNMTEMVIYSFEGKLVLRKIVNARTYQLAPNELPQGVYVAQIGLDSKENQRIKFIVD